MKPVRTLAIWCAEWPATATGRPSDRPVAVVHANRVISVNPAARAEGVAIGLRRREARCPAVELFDRDDSRDARAFEPVLAALEGIAARIEVAGSGRCAVPTVGPSRYHGGDRALASMVLERVSSVAGCPVGIGIADGPLAAGLVAEEAVYRHEGRQPLVVAPGATAAFLAKLPVARLADVSLLSGQAPRCREAVELVDVLRRLGLRTVGRFAALSVPDVSARFGPHGLAALRLARGLEERPPNVGDPPPDLRVSAAIDPPAERIEQAAFVAKALADSLHDELSTRGLACTRVLVTAETEAGDRIERLWRHENTLTATAIAQRVRWQLDGWLSSGRALGRCTGGVTSIGLIPDEVIADSGRQLGFWGGTSEAGERALRALARVQAIVGADAVQVPEFRGGRSPGEQYQLVPLDTVDLGARTSPGEVPWPGAVPSPSPVVVWPKPLPAEVLDVEGSRVGVGGRGLLSAPPVRVSVSGGPLLDITSWAGPWCVEERWWDPVAARRRARLQVVTDDGSGATWAHLLALEAGAWWLEATYD